MMERVVACFFVVLLALGTVRANAQSDTTVGVTKTVSKSKNTHPNIHPHDTANGKDGVIGQCMDACCSGIFHGITGETGDTSGSSKGCGDEVCSYSFAKVLVSPFKHLFAGSGGTDLRNRRHYHEVSIGTGATFCYRISAGPFIRMGYRHLFLPGGRSGVRAGISVIGSENAMYADFQRDVFVNGTFVGVQKDVTKSYSFMEAVLSGEYLFFPGGNEGSFYLSVGAGAEYRREVVPVVRTLNGSTAEVKITSGQYLPRISAGLGRFARFTRFRGDFSITYNACINHKKQAISTPGDNSPLSQFIGLNWTIVF